MYFTLSIIKYRLSHHFHSQISPPLSPKFDIPKFKATFCMDYIDLAIIYHKIVASWTLLTNTTVKQSPKLYKAMLVNLLPHWYLRESEKGVSV